MYGPLDMTVYGRQETFEDSPPGWPQPFKTSGEQFRTNGRPTAQWPRLAAGHSGDLHARDQADTPATTGLGRQRAGYGRAYG